MEQKVRWSKDRSVTLSFACTRAVMALALVLGLCLPYLCVSGFFEHRALIAPGSIFWLMPIYYSFCVPAFIALITLDRMLRSIRNDAVFVHSNVSCLRIISHCCLAAALILLASSLVSVVFFALAILATFFGVIMRVVKNLFAAAVDIKSENDFTI
jgi:hypothetical protein